MPVILFLKLFFISLSLQIYQYIILSFFFFNIYIKKKNLGAFDWYCGGKWSEDILRSMGPAWGWMKAHSYVNLNQAHGLRPRKEDIKTTQNQAKLRKRGSRRRGQQACCSKSLRSKCTSEEPYLDPYTREWSTMEEVRGVQATEKGNIWEGGHHLHIQYFAPTELAAFMRKRNLNSDLTAQNSL